MIVFHEGLPGSGKSYEALVRRVIPALKQGRPVDAYVEGINHAKIAELAGIPEDKARELLRPLTREEAPQIAKLARDNALIVLDEAQNFWPSGIASSKLPADLTQFVTEHRHRGIDIILMGQDHRDVNALWRRRIEVRLCFLKLTAFGSSKRYRVTTERHKGGDKYENVGTEVCTYDPKFFGTYASHVSGDTNTADYKEDRATLWRTPLFRFGLPVAVVIAIWGAFKAYAFFQPDTHTAAAPKAVAASPAASQPRPATTPQQMPSAVQAARVGAATSPAERLTGLSASYRIRLGGIIERRGEVQGIIEWLDGGSRVIERLSLDQLRNMGAAVAVGEGFVRLQLGTWADFATMWPVNESIGGASQRTLDTIRPPQPITAPAGAIGIDSPAPQRTQREEPAGPISDTRPAPRT